MLAVSACQASQTTPPSSNSATASVPVATTPTLPSSATVTASGSPTVSPTATPPPTSTAVPSGSPGTSPAISIQDPLTGSVIPDSNITITVAVSGFKLFSPTEVSNTPGEGHINYFLDVDAPVTQNEPAVTAPNTYASSSSTSYQWSDLSDGVHTFSAELVNNDNTPLNPPVVAKVSITVFTG